jgi:methyltransferase (TIGR00027 family)
MYRAMESERPDALFRDPYARKLAGEQGEEILRTLPKARQFAWPMIVRTAVMDEIILRAVNRDGADTVINLASGLDTRAYRLALPKTLRWFDADFPDMVGYKQKQLAGERPACQLEYAPVDLTDAAARRAFLQRAAAGAQRALVIAEGLLVYLQAEDVAALAKDLHAQRPFRWWLIDLASPRMLKMLARTWGRSLRSSGAPLIFGPAEGTAFFRPHGWEEREYRAIWEESLRLNRTMKGARFWNWLFRFYPRRTREEMKRMSGIVLLERTAATLPAD